MNWDPTVFANRVVVRKPLRAFLRPTCVRQDSVFANNVTVSAFIFGKKTLCSRLARFRQVDVDVPHTHHDALELADGSTVMLTRLVPGQCTTVLQLPKEAAEAHSNGKADLESELTSAPRPRSSMHRSPVSARVIFVAHLMIASASLFIIDDGDLLTLHLRAAQERRSRTSG